QTSDPDAVDLQECERCAEASALVPVYEGLVLRDVKRIRRRHREQIVMEVCTAEGDARHGDRGFERAYVSDAAAAAVPRERPRVNEEDVLKCEDSGASVTSPASGTSRRWRPSPFPRPQPRVDGAASPGRRSAASPGSPPAQSSGRS